MMQKAIVNEDGSVGPFTDTAAAEEWLTDRLSMLCLLTGQKGTPEAHIVAVDTSGHECVCPAIYDSSIAIGKDRSVVWVALTGVDVHRIHGPV